MIVNLEVFNCFEDGIEVISELLIEIGLVSKVKVGVKVLGNGILNFKLIVKVVKFFLIVKEVIEVVGGIVEVI